MSRVNEALSKGSPEESRKQLFEDLADGWKAKALADPAEAEAKKAAAKAKPKPRGRPAKEKKEQPKRQRKEILRMEEQITQCRQALQNLQKKPSEESVADSAATPAKRRATEDPDGDVLATPPPKQAREAKSTQKAAAALATQALILEALTAQLSRHAEALDQKQDVAAATVEQATSKARKLFASAKRAAVAHKARQRLDKTARARTAAAEKAAAAKETGEAVAGAAAETAAAKAAEAKKTGEAASTQAGEEEQAAAEKAAEAKKTDEDA